MRKITVIVNFITHLTNPKSVPANTNTSKKVLRYFLVVALFAVVPFLSMSHYQYRHELTGSTSVIFAPGVVDSLKKALSSGAIGEDMTISGGKLLNYQSIRNFYSRNGYKPVWIRDNGLNGRATSLLYLIGHARAYGLDPDHYHASAITKVQQEFEEITRNNDNYLGAELEILFTDAAFRFMVNLRYGYGPFDTLKVSGELPEILHQGVVNGKIIRSILSVQPGFIEYTRLQRATEKFVKAAPLTDQWVEIHQPVADSVIFFRQIGEVLKTLGYIDRQNQNTDIREAMKQFQHFHGLAPDGKAGINTVEALGQTTLYKYKTLALNLDRLRKQQIPDSNQLLVNIPAYRLKIFEGNRLVDTFRVIVGNPSSPTPLLTARMEKIIANPVWYVPRSITMQEILPKLKTDSTYLIRNRMKILDSNYKQVDQETLNLAEATEAGFNYTLRQDRGSDNSLGQVKFVFSNPYSVYLHDTPGKQMFLKDIRAFSHGCVRVMDPERLAGYIIREINEGSTNINELIAGGTHREIDITAPLLINIMYITCEADENGNLYFYKDIYGMDRKELQLFGMALDI